MSGPTSFEMTQRMGSGGGGAAASGRVTEGIGRSLIGMNMEQETTVNFKSEKDLHLTGADNMEPGLLAMLFKARGEGFFARFFDALASREEAFGTHAMGEGFGAMAHGGGTASGGGGGESGGGSAAGSNRPFSSLPPMDMMGPMSNVSPSMLGRLSPTNTPGMGQGMGMGAGMGGMGV